MFELTSSQRIVALTLALTIACAGPLALYQLGRRHAPALASDATATGSASPVAGARVLVHVAGAVKQPGMYRLAAGARVSDALAAAGGRLENARLDDLNLAARVKDGLRLYVPTNDERREQVVVATEDVYVHDPPRQAAGPLVPSSKDLLNAGKLTNPPARSERKEPPRGRVNLNTASTSELQTLPGIGPAMAARILAYRETVAHFRTPEDLQQVRGIGPKTYEKLKPYITAP
ncbi:MAG: helix-hairpin-helix domain-containing protein [Armatimonadetes bacterium]|nr:helix-hairpin-helix domain-containing protein [Armatimonadota bacterium]